MTVYILMHIKTYAPRKAKNNLQFGMEVVSIHIAQFADINLVLFW
jgi:hypothetical protein